MDKIAPINYRILVCIVEKEGFRYSRTKGDHLVYSRKEKSRPIVIPMYLDVPVFIIKNTIRTMDIDRVRYFELLEQCK